MCCRHPPESNGCRPGRSPEAVYYGREPAVLDGAMFFHATYIKPDWARGKKPARPHRRTYLLQVEL